MFELFPKFGTAEKGVNSFSRLAVQVMTKLLPLETDPTLATAEVIFAVHGFFDTASRPFKWHSSGFWLCSYSEKAIHGGHDAVHLHLRDFEPDAIKKAGTCHCPLLLKRLNWHATRRVVNARTPIPLRPLWQLVAFANGRLGRSIFSCFFQCFFSENWGVTPW